MAIWWRAKRSFKSSNSPCDFWTIFSASPCFCSNFAQFSFSDKSFVSNCFKSFPAVVNFSWRPSCFAMWTWTSPKFSCSFKLLVITVNCCWASCNFFWEAACCFFCCFKFACSSSTADFSLSRSSNNGSLFVKSATSVWSWSISSCCLLVCCSSVSIVCCCFWRLRRSSWRILLSAVNFWRRFSPSFHRWYSVWCSWYQSRTFTCCFVSWISPAWACSVFPTLISSANSSIFFFNSCSVWSWASSWSTFFCCCCSSSPKCSRLAFSRDK